MAERKCKLRSPIAADVPSVKPNNFRINYWELFNLACIGYRANADKSVIFSWNDHASTRFFQIDDARRETDAIARERCRFPYNPRRDSKWTFIPCEIILFRAILSLTLLYSKERTNCYLISRVWSAFRNVAGVSAQAEAGLRRYPGAVEDTSVVHKHRRLYIRR